MSNHNFDLLIEHHSRLKSLLEEFSDKSYIFKNCKLTIWEAFQIEGWYEFLVNHNIEKAKQCFYNGAKSDVYYYKLFTENVEDLFSYGRTHVLQASLSDDKSIMNEYSLIDYQLKKSGKKLVWYHDMVQQGESHIYCAMINRAMNSDISGLSELIEVAKTKTVVKKINEWILLDLGFFQALVDRDMDNIYKVINTLCTSEHKKRNKHSWIYKDLVSQPAQGYAKIAWLNDLQVEVDNPLVHNELLSLQPNQSYNDDAGELISRMTLQSYINNYNGQKLSDEEYRNLYT